MPNSLYTTVTSCSLGAAALDDRNRNLAAGEEAGFLAVVGDQVRLGEALEEPARLQRLDDGADALLALEEEQVQEIAEDQVDRVGSALALLEAGRRELLRRRSGRALSRRDEEAGAELGQRAAIDLGESHLQHDLLALLAAGELQHVDDFDLRRAGLRDLGGAQRHAVARHRAREDDGLVGRADADVFAREQRAQLLLERRDRRLDDEVVVLALGGAPDDQADRAGRLAVDQNLARLDDDGVGDRGIRDRDANDLEIGAEHGRSAGRQHHAFDLPGDLLRWLRCAGGRRGLRAGTGREPGGQTDSRHGSRERVRGRVNPAEEPIT